MPIGINGTGSITGISAGGLPDATITQAELASGVAGTGPAFRAYASTATNVAHSTPTKAVFVTEDFDTNNCYDTGLSRFTPNVAGVYVLSASHYIISSEISGYMWVNIYKNGTQLASSPISAASGIYINSISTIAYANGTSDYFEVYISQNTGATRNSGTGIIYYFSGTMTRAA